MKTLAAILTIGLLASNMAWMHGYRQLHDDWAQSTTILGERDAYIGALPDNSVYQLSTVNGELQAHCANGADATIRPNNEFGTIGVSCGQ